jgi:uncharacterized protein (TIGR03083 family)
VAGAAAWVGAVRSSHDRLTALLGQLDTDRLTGPSYASEWSIAQVASHLGSQAEIFGLFLDAGLSGAAPPGGEVFGPIWDRWNALPPAEQVSESTRANEAFVSRLEGIPDADAGQFRLSMFGREVDLAGLAALRLGEHAVHTWDVAVALDPAATVADDAVGLLVDTLAPIAARGTPIEGVGSVAIRTTTPDRSFALDLDPEVGLTEVGGPQLDPLQLPAEAFVRLVYGRLDPDHTPAAVGDDPRLPVLRCVFPGF